MNTVKAGNLWLSAVHRQLFMPSMISIVSKAEMKIASILPCDWHCIESIWIKEHMGCKLYLASSHLRYGHAITSCGGYLNDFV